MKYVNLHVQESQLTPGRINVNPHLVTSGKNAERQRENLQRKH